MRILLINPYTRIFDYTVPPLGILYIASVIRSKNYKSTFVLDAAAEKITFDRLGSIVRSIKPDIVGVTATALTYRNALETMRTVKKTSPEIFTVIGGIYPTELAESCIQEKSCDCVVIGEGEWSFLELCESLNGKGKKLSDIAGICFKDKGKIVMNVPREPTEDLDSIPFPSYDLLDLKPYRVSPYHVPCGTVKPDEPILPILGSRGCKNNCIFCCDWKSRLRLRSAENIIKEIKFLQNKYHINRFHFFDAVFTVDAERVKELCSRITNEALKIKWFCTTRLDQVDLPLLTLMKSAGCEEIFYGVESGSQLILDRLNKNIKLSTMKKNLRLTRESGIIPYGNLIIGAPGETAKSISETILFARKYLDVASFSGLFMFPNTPIETIAKSETGRVPFRKWGIFSSNMMQEVVYVPQGFTYGLLRFLIRTAHFLFYLSHRPARLILRKIFLLHNITASLRYIYKLFPLMMKNHSKF